MKAFCVTLVAALLVAAQAGLINIQPKVASTQRGPRVYEDKIKAAIMSLAEKLRNEGIPALNLTSVDPLVLNNLHIETHKVGLAELNWTMDAGDISGATNFEIPKLKFNIAGFKFDFGFTWPLIKGHGKYVMDGLFGGVLPVFGEGMFDVSVFDIEVSGSGKLGLTAEQYVRLDQFGINISIDEMQANFTGLMGDESLSELISKMVSDSVPALLDQYYDFINKTITPIAIDKANTLLGNKTIGDIIGGLGY